MSYNDDELPWYLKESGGSNANFFRYVGDFENDAHADADADADSDKSIPPTSIDALVSSTMIETKRSRAPIHRRHRKRPTGGMEYESNPNFVPFTGTVENLLQSTKPIEVAVSSVNSTWSERVVMAVGTWQHVITTMAVTCVIFFIVYKRRKRHGSQKQDHPTILDAGGSRKHKKKAIENEKKAVDSHLPDAVNLDTQTLSMTSVSDEDRSTSSPEEEINSNGVKPFGGECDRSMDECDTMTSCDEQLTTKHTGCESILSASSGCNDLNDMILKGIPTMAKALSLSGLNSQDSLRIATQEYLAARRSGMEEAEKARKLKIIAMDAALAKAMERLQESIISITIGFHFVLCVIVACTLRLFFSNTHVIIKSFIGGKSIDQFEEAVYQWIIRDLCGCLVNANPPISDIPSISSTLTNIGMYLFHYSGMAMVPSMSSQCALKCALYLMFIAGTHRVLRIFHCNALHNILNWILMTTMMIKTAVGRSITILVFEIFIYNTTLCCVAYVRRLSIGRDNDDKGYDSRQSAEGDWEASVNLLREKRHSAEDTRQKLLTASLAGAGFLGVVPVILQSISNKN